MELQEHAQRILFATSLEEKLAMPTATLIDDSPSALSLPEVPGRPADLQFHKGDSDLPSRIELKGDEERARLLHYFANHELLAVELMALAILKFPDAPKAFRKGLARTLKEEQEHTLLYMRRMELLGLSFGDLPVNDFFWKNVSTMESPLDYVARLSLTFEQANLDYSRYFEARFREAGDTESAVLMERIYKDEISHVGYGLKWFRRWKDEKQSDWEAFSKILVHPLSPARAKSIPFNEEGRRKAGLDQSFVRQLKIYSKSKGRSPSVYWFNPFGENHCLEKSLQPKKPQLQWAKELSTLPLFLARHEDIVLLPESPEPGFLERLYEAGVSIPEISVTESEILPADHFGDRGIMSVQPWAWSPDAFSKFSLINKPLSRGLNPAKCSKEELVPFFGKTSAAKWASHFRGNLNRDPRFAGDEVDGVTISSVEELEAERMRFTSAGWQKQCLKADYGFASQSMIRLWEPELPDQQIAWAERQLEQQGQLVLEPWLERLLDFSTQYEVTADGVKLYGIVKMDNDRRGMIDSLISESPFGRNEAPDIRRFLNAPVKNQRLMQVYEESVKPIADELRSAGYIGPFGIDSCVYRDLHGELKIRPVIELNPRFTMGRLTLELTRLIAQGCRGTLKFIGKRDLKDYQVEGFRELATKLDQDHPLQWKSGSQRKLNGGWIPLNDPEHAREALGIFVIG